MIAEQTRFTVSQQKEKKNKMTPTPTFYDMYFDKNFKIWDGAVQ